MIFTFSVVTLGLAARPGRFHSDSGKKQICCADPGFSPSLRSKLACAAILALLVIESLHPGHEHFLFLQVGYGILHTSL